MKLSTAISQRSNNETKHNNTYFTLRNSYLELIKIESELSDNTSVIK